MHVSDSGPADKFKMICRGPSMHPTLKLFDLLHVRPYNSREISRGDVIVLTPPGGGSPVAHRVISCGRGQLKPEGTTTICLIIPDSIE